MLQEIEARVESLKLAVDRSAQAHNSLVGQLVEAHNILELIKKGAATVECVAETVEKAVDAIEGEQNA